MQSAVKLGSRPERIALAFQSLSRHPGPPSKNNNLPYISIGYGGESVSQPPLKDKVLTTFLDQNPPFELRPENGVSPPTKACNAVFRDWGRGRLPSEGKGHTFRIVSGAPAFSLFYNAICAPRAETPVLSHSSE